MFRKKEKSNHKRTKFKQTEFIIYLNRYPSEGEIGRDGGGEKQKYLTRKINALDFFFFEFCRNWASSVWHPVYVFRNFKLGFFFSCFMTHEHESWSRLMKSWETVQRAVSKQDRSTRSKETGSEPGSAPYLVRF